MKGRYNSLRIKAAIEFCHIFKGSFKVADKRVLCQYSRDKIVRLAVLLNKEYCGKPIGKIRQMLSSKDPQTNKARKENRAFFAKVC